MYRTRSAVLFWAAPVLAVAAALAVAPAPRAAEVAPAPRALHTSDPRLAEKLTAARETHGVPALWGAIVVGDELVAVAAVGVRKVGAPDAVRPDDRVHIGSNTKALTATLVALLVDQGKLDWDRTVGAALPALKGKVHDDYLGVTVRQLLAHEGGVVPNVFWWALPRDRSVREQRANALPVILKGPPAHAPGTKFAYSNAGYLVAGAMVEAAGGAAWEELLRDRLFRPLGIARAGFGPPAGTDGTDHPWGHRRVGDAFAPTALDNPPVLGPAGTVHISLPDWAKFVSAHLLGAQGKGKLLRAESFRALHTPTDGFSYAGGWSVGQDGSLAHDGSNGAWYSRARLRPKDGVAVLVACNAGGEAAQRAVADAEKALTALAREYVRQK